MARSLKPVLAAALCLALGACSGGSSTGGGTENSPFVGRYSGTTAVTVSTAAGRSAVERQPISIYVNQDGLVQVGGGDSAIYASGPLEGSRVSINDDATALVDLECSGTVSISGAFFYDDEGKAVFEGDWSSSGANCFGVAGDVTGPLAAGRASPDARASRVFETGSPALLQAFRKAVR